MELPDLKQLTKLIALCRKQGVSHVKLGEFEITLSGSQPTKKSRRYNRKPLMGSSILSDQESEADDEIESDELSAESLLLWSVGNAVDQIGTHES